MYYATFSSSFLTGFLTIKPPSPHVAPDFKSILYQILLHVYIFTSSSKLPCLWWLQL